MKQQVEFEIKQAPKLGTLLTGIQSKTIPSGSHEICESILADKEGNVTWIVGQNMHIYIQHISYDIWMIVYACCMRSCRGSW